MIVLCPSHFVTRWASGERVNFVVNAVEEKSVTIDGNHPLAGLALIYNVELLEVP
jgi:FKBP-type peptidyl-prolyl cis-trans isomerase 2